VPALLTALLLVFGAAQALGLAGTWFHTRGLSPERRRALHGKFAVYALITALTLPASASRPSLVLLAGLVVALGSWEIASVHAGRPARQALGLLVFAPLAAAFLHFALRTPTDLALMTCAGVAALDGFSQVAGQCFGHTPLAPRLSPAKTVEGSIGGVLITLLLLGLLARLSGAAMPMPLLFAAMLAAIGGDLLASACKRLAGVKDFSGLIPFHGGVLDRFDSLVAAGAMVALAGPSGWMPW